MVNTLNNCWPSLTETTNRETWKKAWNTYGTCTIKIFKDPKTYFSKSTTYANQIGDLLQNHLIKSDGIVPCDSAVYKNNQILEAIQKVSKYKRIMFFTCKDKDENLAPNHAYLNEVIFCFNKEGSLVDCVPPSNDKSCTIENIIVPRAPPPPPPRASLLSSQPAAITTGEKFPSNRLWDILGQLF